jgi:hypothetical protein
MTVVAAEPSGTQERRCRVIGDRVACWRIGFVDLDRCRECLYLLRLEVVGTPASGDVVCADSNPEAEIALAW